MCCRMSVRDKSKSQIQKLLSGKPSRIILVGAPLWTSTIVLLDYAGEKLTAFFLEDSLIGLVFTC